MWCAFQVGHPVMVGAVSISARSDFDTQIRLRLYDAFGAQLLATELRQVGNVFSADLTT
jgi:hypothetical protein